MTHIYNKDLMIFNLITPDENYAGMGKHCLPACLVKAHKKSESFPG
jgi:hypothetical protein